MYAGFYSTFIAHIVSSCSTSWSLFRIISKCTGSEFPHLIVGLTLILPLINSAVALLRYGLSNGYKLRKLHVVTLNLSMIGSCTLIQMALHLHIKSPKSYLVTTALNIIPLLHNIKKLDYRTKYSKTDAIIAMNCFFMLLSAVGSENYNIVAFALSYLFGYFYVGDCGYFLDTEVPSIDIYQYMQCFLSYFTVNAFVD